MDKFDYKDLIAKRVQEAEKRKSAKAAGAGKAKASSEKPDSGPKAAFQNISPAAGVKRKGDSSEQNPSAKKKNLSKQNPATALVAIEGGPSSSAVNASAAGASPNQVVVLPGSALELDLKWFNFAQPRSSALFGDEFSPMLR